MANRLHPRVKRTREDVQQCKDCMGNGSMPNPARPPRLMGCSTCNGQGFILHRAPYRLADGAWSDGIDRTHQVRAYGFNKANPTRWTVNRIGESWEAYQYDSERESSNGHFGTHAEAIRYADHHARTTKNGDA